MCINKDFLHRSLSENNVDNRQVGFWEMKACAQQRKQLMEAGQLTDGRTSSLAAHVTVGLLSRRHKGLEIPK